MKVINYKEQYKVATMSFGSWVSVHLVCGSCMEMQIWVKKFGWQKAQFSGGKGRRENNRSERQSESKGILPADYFAYNYDLKNDNALIMDLSWLWEQGGRRYLEGPWKTFYLLRGDAKRNIKKTVKFLGVFLLENLSWKSHINHVCKKISKSTGIR